MSIVTQAMLSERLGADELVRLCDPAGNGSIDASVLARGITEGESEILFYVAQKYTLPLALTDGTTSLAVITKMTDAVVYRLFLNRDHDVREDIRKLYDNALAWGKDIAAGKIGLPGENQLDAAPGGIASVVVDDNEAMFTREGMKGL